MTKLSSLLNVYVYRVLPILGKCLEVLVIDRRVSYVTIILVRIPRYIEVGCLVLSQLVHHLLNVALSRSYHFQCTFTNSQINICCPSFILLVLIQALPFVCGLWINIVRTTADPLRNLESSQLPCRAPSEWGIPRVRLLRRSNNK